MPAKVTISIKIQEGGTTRQVYVTKQVELGGDRRRRPKHLVNTVTEEATRLASQL